MALLSTLADTILFSASTANAVVGGIVLASDKRSKLNQYFFGLSFSVAGWAFTNILFQLIPLTHKFGVALISYAFAAAIAVYFLLFCTKLAQDIHLRLVPLLTTLGVIAGASSLVPGFIGIGVSAPQRIVARAPALAAYGLTLVLLLATGLGLLVYKLFHATPSEKARVKIIITGMLVAVLVGVVCNLILPLVGNYSFVSVGPSGTLLFVLLTAYAIVRHKLFDIRFYVVRASAYALTLAFTTLLYVVPAIYIATYLFQVHLTFTTFLILIGLTLFLTIGYGHLRSYLNAVTGKIFFRDDYDPERFIAQLNSTVVLNLDLAKMLKNAAKVIETNFRAEYCLFGLKETDAAPQRIIGTAERKFSMHDIETVRKATPHMRTKVIITERIPSRWAPMRKVLQENDVAVLARLSSTGAPNEEGIGYIILGAKKGGQQYNSQDIRTLATIIDGLIVAIQNAMRFEEIENFNVTLQERVDQATRELRKSNDKLKALDQTKDEFITMASHQLRTPLTSVKGYLSMVLEGDVGPLNAQQKQLLTQSYVSSQRMVYLISDLLNLSRLNTGKFLIESTSVDLGEVVQAELDQLDETAKSREVTLLYDRPTNLTRLMLDETKTHQVVMNLIDNAIYYTPSGGTIRITIHETPTAIEFRVMDNGIGVPKHEQHKLFAKFYRAQNAQAARPDGTGIGLFMAKKVIVSQGGAIIFESEEGKGSTFGFRFTKADHQVPVLTSKKK
jgi:signal transduction histidine kinase